MFEGREYVKMIILRCLEKEEVKRLKMEEIWDMNNEGLE